MTTSVPSKWQQQQQQNSKNPSPKGCWHTFLVIPVADCLWDRIVGWSAIYECRDLNGNEATTFLGWLSFSLIQLINHNFRRRKMTSLCPSTNYIRAVNFYDTP